MTTSASRRPSSSARRTTATGSVSPISAWTATLACSPRIWSWRMAAGRCRSAATSSGRWPLRRSREASLAAVEVLPEPWRPASMMIVGGFEAETSPTVLPPSIRTSSSWTILITCWPGVRDLSTSSPRASAFTCWRKVRTAGRATSASSSATRISRRASSISFSVSRPRERSLRKMSSRRLPSVSNMWPFYGGRTGPLSGGVPGDLDKGVDEGFRVEELQVGHLLADADRLDRDAELLLDGHDYAAAGGAVQLGQHHAGDLDRLAEGAGLGDAVLGHRGVEPEERLGDLALALRDAADLLQLVHQRRLGVQTAGGVDDHHVDGPGNRVLDGVEDDGAGGGARNVADHVDVEAFRPGPELVDRRGSERVGRGEDDGPALLLQHPGELGDGGRLAGAFDARHQPDARALVGEAERAVGAVEDADELGAEGLAQVLRLPLLSPGGLAD